MNPAKVIAVTLLAGGISLGSAIFGERWLAERKPEAIAPTTPADQIQSLPDFALSDLSGRQVRSRTWAGKVLVLNYWATWCAPCIDEMPMMIRAQQALAERGVQFVGIAVDREEDVKAFLVDHPVNYPVLLADPEVVDLSKQLGNRLLGLPFTVIFDARGRRVYSHTGEIGAGALRSQLDALIGIDATPGAPAEQTGSVPATSS